MLLRSGSKAYAFFLRFATKAAKPSAKQQSCVQEGSQSNTSKEDNKCNDVFASKMTGQDAESARASFRIALAS